MTPERYQKLTLDYFQGKIDASKLADLLVGEVPMTVGDMGVASGERVMFISNHPRLESQTHIPAELIAGLKGGNSRNFPSFWFPALRQAMIRRVMGDRRFLTVAFDIGWPVAMQELWHLLIRPSGNGRAQKIIERMKEENASLVVFPEGGVRDLQVFRTGFFTSLVSLTYVSWLSLSSRRIFLSGVRIVLRFST